MATKSEETCMKLVSERGYSKVSKWTDKPGTYYEPHSHDGPSTIMIVKGDLTIKFPNDEGSPSLHMEPGDVVDIEAGRSHEVWIGEGGCTTVNGDG